MKLPIISGIIDKITGNKDITDNANVPMPIQPPDFSTMNPFSSSEAFYKAAELNIQVDSKENVKNMIWKAHLSRKCKDDLILIVDTMFDRNVLLSDLSGVHDREIAYIRFRIDMLASTLSCGYPSDKNNPEFLALTRYIMAQVWFRITRTGGDERERMIAAYMHIKYTQSNKITSGEKK